MQIGSDLEQRAQYLSLAFFAQGVIDDLVAIIEGATEPESRTEIQDALRSLRAVDSLRLNEDLPAFGTYEEIRTLYEVANDQERAKIIEDLDTVAQAETDEAVRAKAEELLSFFTHLESQALKNFNQADEQIPSGVRQLCRQT